MQVNLEADGALRGDLEDEVRCRGRWQDSKTEYERTKGTGEQVYGMEFKKEELRTSIRQGRQLGELTCMWENHGGRREERVGDEDQSGSSRTSRGTGRTWR